MCPSPRRERIGWPAVLLVGALNAAHAGDAISTAAAVAEPVRFEGPSLQLEQGAVIATEGFVLSAGGMRVICDAARWDDKNDDLYATGNVVVTRPRIRLKAARLGLHPQARTGEAWTVEAWIEVQGRTVHATAKHAQLEPTRMTLTDVNIDGGHGGVVSFHASALHVYLFAEPKRDRDGFEEYVSGVALVSPTGKLIGVPLLWLPYLYRDYYYLYPWTRVRFGQTKRQGNYIHYWIGTNLRPVGDWRTRIEGRVDAHSRAGQAYGANLSWRHPRFGQGQAGFYQMPREEVADAGTNDNDGLYATRQQVLDLEHRVDLGAGAVSARYVVQPRTDATSTLDGGATAPSPDRFRADYLRPDLEHRPFARQGVAGVYALPGVTVGLDTERRANPYLLQTERWLGVQAVAAPIQLVGPLHVGGEAWVEDLHRVQEGTRAVRTNAEALLSAGQWFGPIGLDGDAGLRALGYSDGVKAGTDTQAGTRWLPVADAGGSLRFAYRGSEYTHTVTPRVGVELLGNGRGGTLPSYGFGDSRDQLDEDARYWTAGFTTNVARERSLFNASATARFALRRQDRAYDDGTGQQYGPRALVDITGSAQGTPLANVTVTTDFTYDARRSRWGAVDGNVQWALNAHAALQYQVTLVPKSTTADADWQHQPGVALLASRYRLDTHVVLSPGGRAVDTWFVGLARRMIDGDLFLSYELVRDRSGGLQDQRVGIGFTLGDASLMDPNTPPSWRGTGLNL